MSSNTNNTMEKYKLEGFRIPKRPTPAPSSLPPKPPSTTTTITQPKATTTNFSSSYTTTTNPNNLLLTQPLNPPPKASTNIPLVPFRSTFYAARLFPHLDAKGYPPPPICTNCQMYGHLAGTCPDSCGACGFFGHMRARCPGPPGAPGVGEDTARR